MSSLTENNAATLSTIGQERTRRAIVWLMVSFSIMSYFDRIIMSIAGPFVMAEFHLSETEMGTIYSAFTFTYAILMIPGGRFADRLDRAACSH